MRRWTRQYRSFLQMPCLRPELWLELCSAQLVITLRYTCSWSLASTEFSTASVCHVIHSQYLLEKYLSRVYVFDQRIRESPIGPVLKVINIIVLVD